jgi:hypothetical protein
MKKIVTCLSTGLVTFRLDQIYWGDHRREGEMGGVCSTCKGRTVCGAASREGPRVRHGSSWDGGVTMSLGWDRIYLAQEQKGSHFWRLFNQLSNCQLLKDELILGVGVCAYHI